MNNRRFSIVPILGTMYTVPVLRINMSFFAKHLMDYLNPIKYELITIKKPSLSWVIFLFYIFCFKQHN